MGSTIRVGLGFDISLLEGSRTASILGRLDVLLFPELVDGGYAALARGAVAHGSNDHLIKSFRTVTATSPLCCIGGSLCLGGVASVRTNTTLVFSRGRVIHRYDKIHLFTPTGDHRYFRPGNRVRTFTLSHRSWKVKAGVVICYDLRFPELIRALAVQGMQVLFVPARWPRARDDAWYTLLKARAIENQIFVVGCNARGREGGESYAFDPSGVPVFTTSRKRRAPVHTVLLDLARLRQARQPHNNLRDAVLLGR